MTTTYDVGDAPTVTAEFRDTAGTLTDPTVATFKVKDPAGVVTTWSSPDAAITTSGVGVWVLQLPLLSQSGQWFVRAEGDAPVTSAAESSFYVRASCF